MAEYRLSTLNRRNQQSNRSPSDEPQGRFVNRPCAPGLSVRTATAVHFMCSSLPRGLASAEASLVLLQNDCQTSDLLAGHPGSVLILCYCRIIRAAVCVLRFPPRPPDPEGYPAMEVGITDHIWSLGELLEAA
jgi:hypothetical protein